MELGAELYFVVGNFVAQGIQDGQKTHVLLVKITEKHFTKL